MPRFSQNGDHSAKAKAVLGRKLRQVAEIEKRAGAELDRLISLALELGMRPIDIATCSGLSAGAISMRKRKPLFCEGCGVPMGYPGRGRPPKRCESCR